MENLSVIQELMGAVFAFALVLSVLVFIHEWGHYIVARLNGVKVDVFSIGFGPELCGWTSSSGTRWKLSLIPLGGYVKMFGDANEASAPDGGLYEVLSEEDKKKTLISKSPLQKISVALAGPLANFLLAIFFFVIVYNVVGRVNKDPIIGAVESSSPAFESGLQVGDKIISVNQKPIHSFIEMQQYIQQSPDVPVQISFERQGEVQSLQLTPSPMKINDKVTIGIIGVRPQALPTSFVESIFYAIQSVYNTSIDIFKLLGSVFTSHDKAKQLGSILSIAKMSKDSLEGGIIVLLSFMAMLSINLGVINLLPVPVLDGGHIFIHLIELIIGRPLSQKVQDMLFKIGFGLLIGVMLFTFFNDLERFKVVHWVKGLWSKFF